MAYHDALEVAPHALAAAGHRSAGARAITVRDEIVPLVALDEYFGLDQSSISRRGEDRERHVALVEAGGRRAALLVDALVAQQDIVVKPLDVVQGPRRGSAEPRCWVTARRRSSSMWRASYSLAGYAGSGSSTERNSSGSNMNAIRSLKTIQLTRCVKRPISARVTRPRRYRR